MRIAMLAVASAGCLTHLHVVATPTVADHELAPLFALPAEDGRMIALAEELRRGPVALVFYRGFW